MSMSTKARSGSCGSIRSTCRCTNSSRLRLSRPGRRRTSWRSATTRSSAPPAWCQRMRRPAQIRLSRRCSGYSWADACAAVAKIPADEDGSRMLRYINPLTGGAVMSMIDCYLQARPWTGNGSAPFLEQHDLSGCRGRRRIDGRRQQDQVVEERCLHRAAQELAHSSRDEP